MNKRVLKEFIRILEGPKIPAPKCDSCKTNKFVRLVSPDVMGSSFYCDQCKTGWCQET